MDAETVWQEEGILFIFSFKQYRFKNIFLDHQFYKKWAMLLEPKGQGVGIRGYLLLTINILRKGSVAKIPTHIPTDDSIEANLLMMQGVSTERHKATFLFKIYKAIDVASGMQFSDLSSYVQVDFAGVKV